ncbi:MAG: hypothetical protein OXK81_11705, partial [Chloroflexota bacterium]|nr:hypothetical protein [Chloroflexota bacterium]
LYSLEESNIQERHPNELACFLLHLDKIGVQKHWYLAKNMIQGLFNSSIPEDSKHKLRELKANQGIEE